MAGNWDLIVPVGTTNLITNPSFEAVTTGYTFDGANTGTRTTVGSKFGYASCQCIYQDDLDLARYAITLTAAAHTFSAWVYLASTWDGGAVRLAMENFGGSSITTATTTTTTLATWVRLQITVTPVGGDLVGDLVVECASAPTAGQGIFIDALQCEALSYSTTYCDGDQDGCEWNGTRNASTSTRSAQSRAGGRVYDLDTQYGFKVGQMIGCGAAPQSPDYEEHADQPGGSVSGVKTHGRVFTLAGSLFSTTSISDLHSKRQTLYSVLDPEAVPYTDKGPQPVILRYRGASVTKEIKCHYEGGFEGKLNASLKAFEHMALRFLAPDPFWYQIGRTSAVLDSNDSATLRYVSARLRSTGQWSDLGVTADPATQGAIKAVCVASDGTVYYGGNFTHFDNNAEWDYIVSYTPSTDTWAQVGGNNDFNSDVYAIVEGPDGKIYAGGDFTDCNGVVEADCIAVWNGSAWAAVGDPPAAAAALTSVRDMAFDSTGKLYIVGQFEQWNDIAAGDWIVSWDGSAYAAVGTPDAGATVSLLWAIGIDSSDNIYVGGNFTNFAGVAAADYIAMWNGSAWVAVGAAGVNGVVYTIDISPEDQVYIGGNFTDAGGDTSADKIAVWNGAAYHSLSTGADDIVYQVAVAPDGLVYIAGKFASVGGIATTGIARWNGSSFELTDVAMGTGSSLYYFAFGAADPVLGNKYSLFVGCEDSAAKYFAGTAAVTNGGTAPIYPKLVVSRSGGTSARLISLRNETTGQQLGFNYSLLDGETLTIDMDPQAQTVTSDFFGSRYDAYLVGGDLGTWALQAGSNQVTCFVDVSGATVTAYLLWRDAYKAAD
jgi:hypothetical protein